MQRERNSCELEREEKDSKRQSAPRREREEREEREKRERKRNVSAAQAPFSRSLMRERKKRKNCIFDFPVLLVRFFIFFFFPRIFFSFLPPLIDI